MGEYANRVTANATVDIGIQGNRRPSFEEECRCIKHVCDISTWFQTEDRISQGPDAKNSVQLVIHFMEWIRITALFSITLIYFSNDIVPHQVELELTVDAMGIGVGPDKYLVSHANNYIDIQ